MYANGDDDYHDDAEVVHDDAPDDGDDGDHDHDEHGDHDDHGDQKQVTNR